MTDVSTIEDVARRAGVSVATVSRALRGLPHVSPATRERVRRIAGELDYRANPHASRLAAGRSGTIGVAVPILNSWFYGNILAGVEAMISEDDLDMHLVTVDSVAAMERFVANLPSLTKQVDGIVIVDLFMPEALWRVLDAGRLPVATVGLDTGLFDAVLIDNVSAAGSVVDHLLGLGHERIGFIGGGTDAALRFESAALRLEGMLRSLRAAGVDHRPDLVVAGGFSVDGGTEAMTELLEVDEPPTAVFCASDEMAIGAIRAVRDAGGDVPGDVSVVGFDDHVVSEALGLTTVRQPVSTLAARATDMVLSRRVHDSDPPRRVDVEASLIVRQTTAALT